MILKNIVKLGPHYSSSNQGIDSNIALRCLIKLDDSLWYIVQRYRTQTPAGCSTYTLFFSCAVCVYYTTQTEKESDGSFF